MKVRVIPVSSVNFKLVCIELSKLNGTRQIEFMRKY